VGIDPLHFGVRNGESQSHDRPLTPPSALAPFCQADSVLPFERSSGHLAFLVPLLGVLVLITFSRRWSLAALWSWKVKQPTILERACSM